MTKVPTEIDKVVSYLLLLNIIDRLIFDTNISVDIVNPDQARLVASSMKKSITN